jgi:hypothetical protein
VAIKDILAWLIERHWRDLNIGQLHAHAASDLSERKVEVNRKPARLSARTVWNMLNGHVTKPTRHTCQILAELFRPHIPGINWRWFHTSLDQFKSLVEGGAGAGRNRAESEEAEIAGPSGAGLEDGDDDALEGTYLCYRHSFSANTTNRIAREVLHIYRGESGLQFRMSYLPGTKRRSNVVLEFQGTVEALGPSIMLFGRNAGTGVERRVRTLYTCNDGHFDRPELENYKLGLLSSTREGDGVPCVACTLLIKVQRQMESAEDLNAFMKAATRSDTFEEIVGRDFSRGDWMPLRLFLDNRPARSPKNPTDAIDVAMGRLEGPGPRDPVLRIAQDRFERSMEEIFQRALDADDIVPAFRADWSMAPQDEGSGPADAEEA